ncbi:MAG: polyprenyl synthetase family protein [Thermodesulfobacteriota bacterium]
MNVSPKLQHEEAGAEPGSGAPSPFEADLAKINTALEGHLSSRVPIIEDIARYSVLGQGKRLRPLLFVLSARACGRDGEDLFRSSVIFEIMHAASLLHDDVLDNAEFRRKKPSAASVWGNHVAVLGGDFLYAKSSALALTCGSLPFLENITNSATTMAEGQMLELTHTNNWSLTREEYMEIITAKTAVLISTACACGAITAGAEEREKDCLGQFGLNLGIAFQMIDDLLDYTSTREVFGKPVGKDFREGKITLPLIRTLGGMEQEEAAELEERFKTGRAKDEDYQDIIRRVREDPSLDEIRAEARGYVERAAGSLESLPDVQARQDLLTLNQQLLTRSF